MREILAHLATHRPEQILNFVELMFYSGLRTSEGIGLRWRNIDFRAKEMLIEGGNVYDEETDTTKTSKSRIVLLSARASLATACRSFSKSTRSGLTARTTAKRSRNSTK